MKLDPHPIRAANEGAWHYFLDQYEGGPLYCQKINPLQVPIPPIPGQSLNTGAQHYLIQQGLESQRNYAIRLNETPCIPICSQVVDFYCSTVGKQENIVLDAGNDLAVFLDDCDLQGQSLTQWLGNARIHAAVFGHTFLVVDMLRAVEEIRTQADVQRAGLRPYVYEIRPTQMLNWAFGRSGQLLEAVYELPPMQPEGILNGTPRNDGTAGAEFLYWSTKEWRRLKSLNGEVTEVESGPNPLGVVPIVALYHKRKQAWRGESMIKDSAHMQHTAVNWLSDMLQQLRMTMYSQPVLKTDRKLDQVQVGSAALMVLDPTTNEDFSYVTPDSQAFKDAWEAFGKFCALARNAMGFTSPSGAGTEPQQKSGVSKAWDFFEAEKIMARMAENEQEAVKGVLDLAARWMGQTFTGNVQYATTFDLDTSADDLQSLITMQAAQVPSEAQKEIMRRAVRKLLPSMDPATQKAIMAQIDAWRAAPPPPIQNVPPAGKMPMQGAGQQDGQQQDLPPEDDQQQGGQQQDARGAQPRGAQKRGGVAGKVA